MKLYVTNGFLYVEYTKEDVEKIIREHMTKGESMSSELIIECSSATVKVPIKSA